ncbi:MAG: hypothetical protein QOJ41_716 [Acidobacteriaceae bacterium]|jgi:uncharacterized SAM-binding protein YcdF (DUF218 family)|nr:hypothetical protein [Acidobacteriaceae bacterium]
MIRRFRQAAHNSQRGGILSSLISLLFLIVFCFVLYAARRPLLRLAGESWVVEDPLQQSDALLLLSDDNFFADRATRASELYRQKLAPIVVASGRRLRPSAGIAELMEHDLIERGVPKDRIIRFPHDGDNTREEALALRALVNEKGWRNIIVVTSNYHTRRARYIFQRVFPESVTVRVASARDGEFDPEHWWENRKSLKEFTRELAAMVVAAWELRRDSSHTARLLPGGMSLARVQA